jgi:hypothetical protein
LLDELTTFPFDEHDDLPGAAALCSSGPCGSVDSSQKPKGEATAMAWVRCETKTGLSPSQAVAAVKDVYGQPHFLLVDRDYLTVRNGASYLPVGVVFQDREKGVALIEFAEEADSGAWRAWVSLADLLEKSETAA